MKSKKNINTEILVGLFLFAMIIALSVFTIILGGSKVLKSQYNYEIIFNDIGGLQEGDGVFLRGKKIGYVKNTILNQDNVNVVLSLDIPVTFYENYRIEVASATMLGGKILNIDLGQMKLKRLPESEVLYGLDPINVMADFHVSVHNLKNILDENIIQELEIEKVTERVANGTGPLGQLLSEDNKVIDDLQQAVNELNIALIKLNSTNSTIGKLLNDSELYDEGTKIIDDVRKSPLRFLIRNSEQ